MDELLAGAVENVLAFDRLNPTVREKVAIIFKENGISDGQRFETSVLMHSCTRSGIPVAGGVAALPPTSVAAFGRWTVETVGEESAGEAGLVFLFLSYLHISSSSSHTADMIMTTYK